MERTHFNRMDCPIARSLERVGEWWSILILRDAFAGASRFDEFEKSLGIAPNMLTRRLNALVEAGLMERVPYSARPLRHRYLLTPRGRDFRDVLIALLAYGNRNFAPEGATMQMVDVETGDVADPIMVDRRSGRPIDGPGFRTVAGPAATEKARARLTYGPGRTASARSSST